MKNLAELKDLLQTPRKICIVTHKNPDGDAVGSSLALQLALQKMKHEVTAIVPNDFPDFLKWIPHQEKLLRFDKNKAECKEAIHAADLIFTLDFNDLSRCGDVADALKNVSADFAMIDHHQQPADYAKFTYSDDKMGSTCEMIFHFLEHIHAVGLLDKDIATCIYVGIMTDTGSFRFPATSSTTHQVVAKLIEAGADNSAIHQQTFDVNSYQRMQLLGVALKNLSVIPEYKTAYIHLSKTELETHNYKKGDTEGFVNYGLSLAGVVFAVIFIESLDEDLIKISFRSKGDFDVNQFARTYFEGGGHKNAAGGRSMKNLTETLSYFKEKLSLQDDLKK